MERSMQRVEDFPINVCTACGESRQEERVKKNRAKIYTQIRGGETSWKAGFVDELSLIKYSKSPLIRTSLPVPHPASRWLKSASTNPDRFGSPRLRQMKAVALACKYTLLCVKPVLYNANKFFHGRGRGSPDV